MKVTMYKLLELVKDGKTPKKIKYNDYEYRYHDKKHGYCRSDYDCTYICLDTDYCLFNILNDEVEILEEEKKIPEKLKWIDYNTEFTHGELNKEFRNICNTVDEIINYLDYLKSKGDE